MFISKKELNDIRKRLETLEQENDMLLKFKQSVEDNLHRFADKINTLWLEKKFAKPNTKPTQTKPLAKKRGRPVGSKNKKVVK